MKKLEYLRKAINSGLYKYKRWYFELFSVTKDTKYEDLPKEHQIPYMVFTVNGLKYFIDENQDHVELDSKKNEQVFTFKDKITVTEDWYPGISKPIDTTIGNLLVNYILLYTPLGTKIPFKIPPYSIKTIEKEIADRMVDNDAVSNPDDISVDDYLKFIDATNFLSGLSTLSVVSSTIKTITPPPGIEKFRKQLIEKYKDSLDDFSTIAAIEKELREYDAEYLKDDPTFNKFMTGKILNVARKRMFLTFGAEPDNEDPTVAKYVESSLQNGWPKTPEELTAMFNTIRSGSYSRGVSTRKGGVLSKIFARALNVYLVNDGDCGSKDTISWNVIPEDKDIIIGRYHKVGSKITEITKDNFDGLVGKTINLRSPLYCIEPGSRFCSVCSGKALSLKPEAPALAAMEISGIILNASMKAMHGKVLKNKDLDIVGSIY